MESLKDKLWIWGHPTNMLKGVAGISKDSDVTPVAGAMELGANNIFYVPCGRTCDRDLCNQEMKGVAKVGWSIESEEQIFELIEQKEKYPNLAIAIFDDFFSEENKRSNYTNYTIEKMIELRECLHKAGIEMWIVLYTMQLNQDMKGYLELFDGVSFWFWHEATNEEFEGKCQWLFENAVGQKKMIGCYLYDFGNERETSAEIVRSQLDKNRIYLLENKIEGIILHTNAVGGMGFEAYEEAKRWVAEHEYDEF